MNDIVTDMVRVNILWDFMLMQKEENRVLRETIQGIDKLLTAHQSRILKATDAQKRESLIAAQEDDYKPCVDLDAMEFDPRN